MTDTPVAAALPIVVLISGNGSNLQAIIDAVHRGELPATIRAVISNRPQAFGLERARRAGIPALAVDHGRFADRESFDAALQAAIDDYRPALVVLAGFMRILTPAFVRHYHGRMLNIHPSLLPAFRGLDTHRRALAAGVAEHGLSIHFVTDELDGGPVIIQKKVPILPGDDVRTLTARVQDAEHRLYPRVIRWFAEGRLQLCDHRVIFDGKPLAAPLSGGDAV
jgi:phosphoribosylglycinamide formyltransferase-1